MKESGYGIGYSIANAEDYALAKLGPALDEAAELGADYVELALYGLDVVANGRILAERLKRVKALTSGLAFGYTIHGPLSLNLMLAREEAQAHKAVLKAHLEIAAELGGVHFVAHAGRMAPGKSGEPEAGFARQREALAKAGDYAQAHGITIVVENVFGKAGLETPLPSRLAAEIEAIGHPAIMRASTFRMPSWRRAMSGRISSRRRQRSRPWQNICTSTTVSANYGRRRRGTAPNSWPMGWAICICRLAWVPYPGTL